MGTQPHKLETPKLERYGARNLVEDNTPFTNAVVKEWVVPCQGAKFAWVRHSATAAGSLAIRLRRTNGDEYPVGVGPADVPVVAATPAETLVTLKGVKEFVIRMTPTANGAWNYLDVGFEGP
jgi:hypothetical protein